MTSQRTYEVPDAPGTYSDHYLLVDKSGAISATKVRVDAFKDWLLAGYTSGYVGGNIATITTATAAAGQKVVTVLSTSGFVAGGYAVYSRVDDAFEYNLIATVTDPTHLLLTTNIGATGIGSGVFVGLISPEQYASANAIPHAGALVMPDTIAYANQSVHNVDAYGALGNGTTDDTAAIGAACTALSAAGGGVLTFAAGKTYLLGGLDGGVTIPSNTRIIGNGAIIYTDMLATDNNANYRCFFVDAGSSNIDISGLTFSGDNDFTPGGNIEHAAIYIAAIGTAITDVHIHHCTFKNLFGFAIHDLGGTERVHVTDCQFLECANGINVNSDYSMQCNNVLSYCEGFECSGAYANISNNIIDHAITAISLGGTTSPGDTVVGQIVSGNIISDTTTGIGISVNDGCENARVEGNVLVRTYGSGIQINGGGYNPVKNVAIVNNTLRSCGADAASTHIGIYAGGTGIDNLLIAGNFIHNNAADTSHETTYGIILDAVSGAYIHSNIIAATSKNISLNGTLNVRLGKNECDTSKNEAINGATFASGGVEFANVGGDYTVMGNEELVYCWGATATHAITLPAAAEFPKFKRLTVKDIQGAAGAYTITITPNGAEKIDGAATKTITTNYGVVTIYSDGANWFTV